MRCGSCGTDNVPEARYCKICGALLKGASYEDAGESESHPAVESPGESLASARFLTVLWKRKGPILMALFIVLMMAMVFVPWAYLKLDILGFQIVSNTYSGWGLVIPRMLLYISILPLLVSLMMIAGIGTRRRVIETHVCTFFAGMMFTIWLVIFSLSRLIGSLVKNVRVLEVNVSGGQLVVVFLLAGFILGIIITTYDRGKEISEGPCGDE